MQAPAPAGKRGVHPCYSYTRSRPHTAAPQGPGDRLDFDITVPWTLDVDRANRQSSEAWAVERSMNLGTDPLGSSNAQKLVLLDRHDHIEGPSHHYKTL